jgi:hypothetical protein
MSYFVRLLRMTHDTTVTDYECLFATRNVASFTVYRILYAASVYEVVCR